VADGILFFDGGEGDDVGMLYQGGLPSGIQLGTSWKRSGNKGYRHAGFGALKSSLPFATQSEIVVGYAVRLISGLFGRVIQLVSQSGPVLSLDITGQNLLRVFRHVSNTTLGTTTRFLAYGSWAYVEFRVKVHATLGEAEIRVNNRQEILLTGQNTAPLGTGDAGLINQLDIGKASSINSGEYWWDDIYARIGSYGFLGDCAAKPKRITAAGSSAQFTPSAGSNFENVDETTPDDDSTHNESDTAGEIDLHDTESATFGSTIHAVQTQLRARKTGTDLITVRDVITDNAGTNKSNGVTHNPGYPDYETLPPNVFGSKPSGGAWTQSALDALEIGYERVA
jgi:hypothetical protein